MWQGIPLHLYLHMRREDSRAPCETTIFESINGAEIPKITHLRPGEALNIRGHIFRVEEPIAWTGASGEIKLNRCWNASEEDVYPFRLAQKPLYILPFYASFRMAYESPVGQFSVSTLARLANEAHIMLVRLNEQLDEDSRFSLVMKPLVNLTSATRDNLCQYSFKVRKLHDIHILFQNELSPWTLILRIVLETS